MEYRGARAGDSAGEWTFVLFVADVDDLLTPLVRGWAVKACGLPLERIINNVCGVALAEGVDLTQYRPAQAGPITDGVPYRWLEFEGKGYWHVYPNRLPGDFTVRLDDYQLRGGVHDGHLYFPLLKPAVSCLVG